jgi:hypothetical protein
MLLTTSAAKSAFQAPLPDLMPKAEQGLASGVKSALNVIGIEIEIGIGIGFVGTQLIVGAASRNGLSLVFLATVLTVSVVLVMLWVPPVPPDSKAQSQSQPSVAAMLSGLVSSVTASRGAQPLPGR